MKTEGSDMENFKGLIAQYLTDEISKEEMIRLASWIDQHPDNAKYFNELIDIWQFSGTTIRSNDQETQNALHRLKIRMSDSGKNFGRNPAVKGKGRQTRHWISMAASILFFSLVGGSITYFFLTHHRQVYSNPQTFKISTPYGTRSELTLADGSHVWLNAGSTLTYDEDFNIASREVSLIGEAYFEVAKDQNRPFIVRSSDLQIRAVGTSFNVKAYPDDQMFTTTLIEGKIIVKGTSITEGDFEYTLVPSQRITILKSPKENTVNKIPEEGADNLPQQNLAVNQELKDIILQENVNTVLYTSWKDKRWVIQQESFSSLAVMLERRYNVNIAFKPDDMEGFSFTGVIENETLEQVIQILQLSAPLKYEFGKGEVKVDIDESQLDRFQRFIQRTDIPNN